MSAEGEDRTRSDERTPAQAVRVIYDALPIELRRQLRWTAALTLVGAIAELATIGAALPFLAIAAQGKNGRFATMIGLVERVADLCGLSVLTTAALLLIGFALLSAAVRLILSYKTQHIMFAIASDLSVQIYDRILHQTYAYHVRGNSSRIISAIDKVQQVFGEAIVPAMQGFGAAVISAFIVAGMLWVDWVITLLAALIMATLYLAVSKFTRPRLHRASQVVAADAGARVQAVQEGVGGIRDMMLDHSQQLVSARFARIEHRIRDAQASINFIIIVPRYLIEAAGTVLIAVLTLVLAGRPGGLPAALPTLGALALGAQRVLPLLQQIYHSSLRMTASRSSLDDLATLLELDRSIAATRLALPPFANAMTLDHVSFSYAASDMPALHDVSLTIRRGTRIGIAGRSGAGKSTLVDLVLGLLDPTSGCIKVDGRVLDAGNRVAWQAQVAHVPQAIFLADASIAANIAFGHDESTIDMDGVAAAARGADLDAFVMTLGQGYATMVGERGIRLSGGQRQRIGIARALFKGARVLVLDEATSALDDETEATVIAAINSLPPELTVIAIAHRTSTLRMCDTVVRLKAGRVVASGTYAQIIGKAAAE